MKEKGKERKEKGRPKKEGRKGGKKGKGRRKEGRKRSEKPTGILIDFCTRVHSATGRVSNNKKSLSKSYSKVMSYQKPTDTVRMITRFYT